MKWSQINRKNRLPVNGGHAPDPNEEYFFYQTLVRMAHAERRPAEWSDFVERMKDYLLKAIREGKVNTGSPDKPPQRVRGGLREFVEAALDRRRPNE